MRVLEDTTAGSSTVDGCDSMATGLTPLTMITLELWEATVVGLGMTLDFTFHGDMGMSSG